MPQVTRVIRQLLILAAFAATAPAAAAQDQRPVFAVVDFESTPSGSTIPPPHLGSAAAQLLVDHLVAAGHYRIVDGRWLQPRAWNADPGTAAFELRANAQDAGVDYLVFGAITRFSTENRQRSAGGAGFRLPFLGGYRRESNELVVSMSVSVVDVRTGEVVGSTMGTGTGSRRKIAAGALAAVSGGVTSGSSGSRDAQLDEAIRQAAAAAASGVLKVASRISKMALARADENGQH
jgi:curli biogenesis system outer membrane secretion channel CsgG